MILRYYCRNCFPLARILASFKNVCFHSFSIEVKVPWCTAPVKLSGFLCFITRTDWGVFSVERRATISIFMRFLRFGGMKVMAELKYFKNQHNNTSKIQPKIKTRERNSWSYWATASNVWYSWLCWWLLAAVSCCSITSGKLTDLQL